MYLRGVRRRKPRLRNGNGAAETGWAARRGRVKPARRTGPEPRRAVRAGRMPGAGGPAPGEGDGLGPQCDEERTDEPAGTRVASTMSWVSLSGSAVIRLTTTMAIRLTGIPMIPNLRWSMPIHGSMPANRTM